MSVSALLSWKEQQICLPCPANLPKTNQNCEHLYGFSTSSVSTFPSSPSKPRFVGAVSPEPPLAALASPPLSFGRMSLWPMIWDSKLKGSWIRGEGNLHTQWNDLIPHEFQSCFQILILLFWWTQDQFYSLFKSIQGVKTLSRHREKLVQVSIPVNPLLEPLLPLVLIS